ncbi:uncharacterized protein LOC128746321 [Sabethes cyaneus]|uniref:uncharacterized protein LOC128746321 n=1 Tax=Sabethes cyaneus TaxID=53552 RepID=UPI00237E3492|nr:uncharacterized protein LOC128746321 [Sabethes cyaneus]
MTPNACQACNELDNSRMVQCDMCDDWYHFDCVGVNQDVENHDWLCSVCMEKQQTKNKKSTKYIPLPVPSVSTLSPISTSSVAPLSTAADMVTSMVVTSMFPTNTVYPTIGQNITMPPVSQMPPHYFMPPHSLISSNALLPPYSFMPPLYSIPPCQPMQVVCTMPSVPSSCWSNPYASLPGVNTYDMCNTVPFSFTQPIPSIPNVVPNTVPIERSQKPLPNPVHTNNPPKAQQVLEDNLSQHSAAIFGQSVKQRQLQMELQILDDERKIQEEEETNRRQYLRKRHELMTKMVRETTPVADVEEERSNQRVSEWISETVNANVQDTHCPRADVVPEQLSQRIQRRSTPAVASTHPQEMPQNMQPISNQRIENAEGGFFPRRRSTPRQTSIEEEDDINLTRKQIAARQAVSRDLPSFSGTPEEWPLFYSTFTTTTNLCRYTSEENLVRLCCLEIQKSSCRTLSKIHCTPAPKADKLDTLVEYSLAVQNLCATIEACQLEEYTYNVALLHELVDKLPPSFKVDWAKHRRDLPRVNLTAFSAWLYQLAETVCPIARLTCSEAVPGRGNKKNSAYVNTHSEESSDNPKEKPDHRAKGNPSGPSSSGGCVACKGNCPKLEKCQRFNELSYNARWAIIKEFMLCRKCLKKHKGSCKSLQVCGKNGCTFKHHELLHNYQRDGAGSNPSSSKGQNSNAGTQNTSVRECNAHHKSTNQGLFRVVPVVIHGPKKSIKTYAFLDDGSSLTLVDASLVQELGLKGNPEPLCLKWTGNKRRLENDSLKLDIDVSGTGEIQKKYCLRGVHTICNLDLFHQTVDVHQLAKRYRHLRGIPIESYNNVQPRILIGIDNANITLPLKGREGNMFEPIATKTRLGWIVHGGSSTTDSLVGYHSVEFCPCSESSDHILQQSIQEYFSLEGLGICKSKKPLISGEEERAQQLLQSVTQTDSGRYEVHLLWKYDKVHLPNSKPAALRRFHCLENRMKKQPKLAEVLRAKIDDYRRKGYIRKLSNEELQKPQERVWYLPLFPVINPNKPGKVRFVWDAAAMTNGVSLNSMLLKGPDLLTPLDYVLYRFREFRIGLSGDVREMYLQMLMAARDQHCLRVLWSDDGKGEPSTYVTQVMPFGTSCSPSCAQYVKNLNASNFAGQYPQAAQTIIKQHYVDDMLASVETEEEAIQLAKDVKHVHAQAGLEMRNWISNSPAVVEAMKETKTDEKNLNLGPELGTEKVLGMWWCTATDTFTYKLSVKHDRDLLAGTRKPTKREVLRTLMAVFDPLGLISNVLVYLKVLFQEIWRCGIDWDDEIPDSLNEKWEKWIEVLPKVQYVRIPRCYRSITSLTPETNIQLHTFVDASLSGFAAVVYLRIEQGSSVECAIVGAKARVSPLKFVSIPRLELKAAVIGVRLADRISKSLTYKIDKRVFWSDSRDVLCWIRSDRRRYSQFVAARVSEILETTEMTDWRYINTKDNVADDATKWERQPDLTEESRWFTGPKFLWEHNEYWPVDSHKSSSTNEELRANLFHHIASPPSVIDVRRFSRWQNLLRATAVVLRVKHNFRCVIDKLSRRDGLLTADELRQASIFLFRQARAESYPDEIRILASAEKSKKSLMKASSIYKLNPFLDEHQVLRMHGRISACEYASMDARNPIILSQSNYVAWLVVKDCHERFHHRNHTTVLNELRHVYRIPRLKQLFDKVKAGCQMCKNEKAVPQPPPMGDLPEARLAAFTRPFSFVGVDYFGPINVVVGRRVEKRWGVLTTCLTVRAIHLEVAHSLSADSCIIALRNMMARRGVPIKIYSDRGTNFTAASKELKAALQEMDQEAVVREIVSPDTEWVFLPPASPHMGGAWERLVQTVKRNLAAIRPVRNPTDESLRNMLIEVENTINSRPLTHVPVEDPDAPVLTPNHFLLGSSSGFKPASTLDNRAVALRRSWCASQVEANIFWQRWVRDYMPDLTKRTKWFSEVKPIEVNDVAVVVDPALPRSCWPKGRIIAVNQSKDGQVRSAVVQTMSGVYERPATKLAILDVRRDRQVSQEPGVPGGECYDPSVGASHYGDLQMYQSWPGETNNKLAQRDNCH